MSTYTLPVEVIISIVAGLLIAVFYVRAMWAALQQAVRTRDEAESKTEDTYPGALQGAVISVALSSVAIALYGAGPVFLYLGPLFAFASPIAVTYCLRQELTE